MNTPFTYNPTYQARIVATVNSALQQHKRITAVRIDLRIPDGYSHAGHLYALITRFFESLKAKVTADLIRKQKLWGRSLECNLKYVWTREFGPISGKKHFHVLLMLNKDVYGLLGDFNKEAGNLSAMIRQAWCSALGLPFPAYQQQVHFPSKGTVHIDVNHSDFTQQRQLVLAKADYLAKEATKHYGDGERSFGCSR